MQVNKIDLGLGGGRTLHVYDTVPDGGAGHLAIVWHHGTPNIGELALLDGGNEFCPLRSRAVQHLVPGEMVVGAKVYRPWMEARHGLKAHVGTSSPGALPAASFLSSSARE